MSLPLLVAINALAAIVLLAGLAYAVSRPTLLKPHAAPRRGAPQPPTAEQALVPQLSWRPSRPTGARQPASMSSCGGSPAVAAYES